MSEIVVQGETFKIKGSEPTPREQLAIDSVLGAKKAEGSKGLSFDDEMKLMIKPEDVLSEAQKGKYNKDTESFLASPGFMRIVTEVGLSIAGGIAGVAAAPFTGGGSLVATGVMAARVARIARPLLNLSRNKQKILAGVTGAGIGGGAGAAIAQTFDPKESIVREVARATAQGAGGELLGFGLAGGLAKIYNKVTGASLKTIDGAQEAIKGLDADKLFYKEIAKIRDTGKLPAEGTLDKLIGKNLTEEQLKKTAVISPQQRAILEDAELSKKAFDSAQEANPQFFKFKKNLRGDGGEYFFEKANIIAGKLTEQPGVELASSLATASIGGGGFIRTAEGLGRVTTMESIENFTNVLTRDLPKIDYDGAADGVTAFLNGQITKSDDIYQATKNSLWEDLSAQVTKATVRTDGTLNPAYNVKIMGAAAQKPLKVFNSMKGKDEIVSSLDDYVNKAVAENAIVRSPEIQDITSMVQRMGTEVDYNNFRRVYGAIGKMRLGGTPADSVKAEVLKRMESMLANSPLPASVNNARVIASQFTKQGAKPFNNTVIKNLMNSEFGRERLYKNIIGAGKPTYLRSFFQSLDDAKFTVKGKDGKVLKKFDVFPERAAIKESIQGQFFNDFLRSAVNKEGQYFKLDRSKASKFLSDYKWVLKEDAGLLTQSQIKGIKDYTKRLQIIEGKIKPPGSGGTSGEMLVQMKQAGALTQIVGVVGFGTGTIDPGMATMFVLGPAGLAKAMANPKVTKLLIDGLGGAGKNIDDFTKLTRYVGQLSSALVTEGIIGADQAQASMNELEGNEEAYNEYFKTGFMPNAPAKREFDPENAPAIEIDPYILSGIEKQKQTEQATTSGADIPLPDVMPANIPSSTQNPQTRMALASGDLYGAIASQPQQLNKGGIVSAKKNF
tara:strand:- start:38 stop:2731 length:2694 start_codon:yes stop_codon:yes gene_type:complete